MWNTLYILLRFVGTYERGMTYSPCFTCMDVLNTADHGVQVGVQDASRINTEDVLNESIMDRVAM